MEAANTALARGLLHHADDAQGVEIVAESAEELTERCEACETRWAQVHDFRGPSKAHVRTSRLDSTSGTTQILNAYLSDDQC